MVWPQMCAYCICRYFTGWFRGDGRRCSIHHILDFILASFGAILCILPILGWLTPEIGAIIGTVDAGDETNWATLEYVVWE